MLINATNITLKYLDKTLVDNASFVINEGCKIGLIGVNGAGKSTLLKAIVGLIPVNSGIIAKKKDIKIAYLSQSDDFDLNMTVLDTMLSRTSSTDYECKSMAGKMGITDFNAKVGNLSGGEKKRLSLAICLIEPSDLLILDEPTNHLDIFMINFLEKFLLKFNRSVLLVTHDRYFLERVTSHTMEIDSGNVYYYQTNYSGFLLEKAKRLDDLLSRNRKLVARYEKEAAWAALNPQARTTKSKERLAKFDALQDELTSIKKQLNNNDKVELNSLASRMGKTTVEINNISKSLNGVQLFSKFSYNVSKYDRLGIVGGNGSGKTTLFKTILGELVPDTGCVKIGQTIKIGYLEQETSISSESIKVIDYLKSFGEYVDTTNGRISASMLAENYLFTPSMQYSPISKLSGGEKKRLQLLSVLLRNPNILFFDEPTNDLDIYTLETLETYLETFKGAVIVVSHDRYFLDKVVDHLLVFSNGNVHLINSNVSDYVENAKEDKQTNAPSKVFDKVTNIPRFTSQEKKEFDNIDNIIEELEMKISNLKKELSLCTTDYQQIMSINSKIDELNIELDKKLERWEYLNKINEDIIKYKENKYNGG